MTRVMFAVTLLAALQGKGNPDFKYDEKAGVSIQKFPKNDEWDFKDMPKFLKAPKLIVAHKVDELTIEVAQIPPQPNTTGFDLKKIIESDSAAIGGDKNLMDVKQVETKPTKLPNGGGNGANAMFLEMTFKLREAPMELREWAFVAKENQCLYIVMVSAGEGIYKKHQKIIEFILGNVKTYKIPK